MDSLQSHQSSPESSGLLAGEASVNHFTYLNFRFLACKTLEDNSFSNNLMRGLVRLVKTHIKGIFAKCPMSYPNSAK